MKRSHFDSSDSRNHESGSKRLTRAIAGEKEWKWKHYFSQFSNDILDKIEMDETALFSVTIDRDADVISKAVRSLIPEYSMVCDATACVGGNTISFAKNFRHVTSIEMDPLRFEMLRNNVTLAGYVKHVSFVNMDFLKFKEDMPYFDFIFFDPPWGGEDYQQESSLDMFLSNISIADVVLSLRGKTRFVGLKSPMNFRLSSFEKRIKANKIYSKEFTISRNKGTYWVFTLYEFESDFNGGVLHMLSPALDSSILTQIITNQKTAIQSPSYKESDFVCSCIMDHCNGLDTLFDLTASIGIQEINFLSSGLFASHIYLTTNPRELENNIHALTPRLSSKPHFHFIHYSDSASLKERLHDNKRVITSANCCVYIDLYNELSVDQIKHLSTNPKVTINKIPIEVCVQQCIEYGVNIPSIKKVVIRVPKMMETLIANALGCFDTQSFHYEQQEATSSCCPRHETCLFIVNAMYPQKNYQLTKIWNTLPHCLLRKQINSIFSTVLADRPNVMSILTQAITQASDRSDSEILEIARKAYFTSFNLTSSSSMDKATAIKIDRSIVRVYGNKMKYVDMVVPVGCRPQQILCLGGIDAHLAHDLAKMYGCSQKEQVMVFGESDRRREENRTDYQFIPYPKKESQSWTEYREHLLITLHEALESVSSIDMVVVCCPHAIPFFGSILSSLINKLSPDAVLVINDHSVTNRTEEILLDIVHEFHRTVTSCHVDPLLDREELAQLKEFDEDDKCSYFSSTEWETRLKLYGLTRYTSEKNKALWNTNDPTNMLKSIWGCFQYSGLRD